MRDDLIDEDEDDLVEEDAWWEAPLLVILGVIAVVIWCGIGNTF